MYRMGVLAVLRSKLKKGTNLRFDIMIWFITLIALLGIYIGSFVIASKRQ
jgi:beta-lactamase regulating signal transducer with metallopeptidase domain